MNALEAVEKEIVLSNQSMMKRPTLKATVKVTLLTKEAKQLFGLRFQNQKENIEKRKFITFDNFIKTPREYWKDKELHDELEELIGTKLKSVPNVSKVGAGRNPDRVHITGISKTLKEGEDFKYEIILMTEYVYETDAPLDWDDIQPIE